MTEQVDKLIEDMKKSQKGYILFMAFMSVMIVVNFVLILGLM